MMENKLKKLLEVIVYAPENTCACPESPTCDGCKYRLPDNDCDIVARFAGYILDNGIVLANEALAKRCEEYDAELLQMPNVHANDATRREGWWEVADYDDNAICSECHADLYDFKEPLHNPHLCQYCSCCGAKMLGTNYRGYETWEELLECGRIGIDPKTGERQDRK